LYVEYTKIFGGGEGSWTPFRKDWEIVFYKFSTIARYKHCGSNCANPTSFVWQNVV